MDEARIVFLAELLQGANASLAAARANLNRGTVYRWKLEDPEFTGLWAEIVASRPRRRNLRRRVLERVKHGVTRRETSQLASHGTSPGIAPEAAWDNDLGSPFRDR
jgi:transposase